MTECLDQLVSAKERGHVRVVTSKIGLFFLLFCFCLGGGGAMFISVQ